MSLFDYLPTALRAAQHLTEIEAIAARLKPYWLMIQQDAPDLIPRIQKLVAAIFPTTPGPAPTFNVRWIQSTLNLVADAQLDVDGEMGQWTHAAIRLFQDSHGLTVDGWAGPDTCALLFDLSTTMEKTS